MHMGTKKNSIKKRSKMNDQMSEFLRFNEITNNTNDEFNYFNRERTLALIHFYKSYKKKVGSGDIKNLKKLWEIIAQEMSNLFKITINATKCENKIKVLERNYKKVIDNNNKTGRGRKTFDYQDEFDEIYKQKANVRPIVLLSSDKIITSKSVTNSCPSSEQPNGNFDTQPEQQLHESEVLMEVVESTNAEIQEVPTRTSKKKRQNSVPYVKRNDILKEMKNDLKAYYNQKLEIERKKLEIAEKKLQDRQKRTAILEKQAREENSEN